MSKNLHLDTIVFALLSNDNEILGQNKALNLVYILIIVIQKRCFWVRAG